MGIVVSVHSYLRNVQAQLRLTGLSMISIEKELLADLKCRSIFYDDVFKRVGDLSCNVFSACERRFAIGHLNAEPKVGDDYWNTCIIQPKVVLNSLTSDYHHFFTENKVDEVDVNMVVGDRVGKMARSRRVHVSKMARSHKVRMDKMARTRRVRRVRAGKMARYRRARGVDGARPAEAQRWRVTAGA
ncbi:hypothetical protein EVAR_83483_1 [Eumeta japonica]|uniref:Uncharacterized protein n=1 Tax=Eumeta variegata TaxID=151549 RepID=A0A4C1ZID9_EUMVA|nr:hypothetical protein EVAR_83483_1 [Eumeta japonica]